MNPKHFCVIMAGGHNSFLRPTYERFLKIVVPENILVVTLEKYSDAVMAAIPELPAENLLLEPYPRGTAPCMTYAMYTILHRCPDAVILATPADHCIQDQVLFARTMSKVADYVEKHDVLMTLGIVPTTPDANFGYIQVRGGRKALEKGGPVQVKTFTEKPDEELASVFIATGEFFWNSGIFAWKARVIREEMEYYLPEVTELFNGWEACLADRGFIHRAYAECPKISLDYGIMERTGRAWLYPARFDWADRGRDQAV